MCALFMCDCRPLKLLVQQRRTHIDKVAQSVESSESCSEPPLPPPSQLCPECCQSVCDFQV